MGLLEITRLSPSNQVMEIAGSFKPGHGREDFFLLDPSLCWLSFLPLSRRSGRVITSVGGPHDWKNTCIDISGRGVGIFLGDSFRRPLLFLGWPPPLLPFSAKSFLSDRHGAVRIVAKLAGSVLPLTCHPVRLRRSYYCLEPFSPFVFSFVY